MPRIEVALPPLRRTVPSLAALVSFEAAARLGGFTLAARELGVTQAAVSRQIRALEGDLRTPLFVRAHRRVELTPAGNVLAMALSQSFDRIADAIDVIRPALPEAPRDTLTLGASLAVSHFWLVPRLATFRAAHPQIALRLVSQDLPIDLRSGAVDIALRYGRPPFRDGEPALSIADEVVPVCSPALARSVARRPFPQALLDLPRIDAEAHEASWLTWRRWCALVGLARPAQGSALRFTHYNDAVYAAIDGQGVALGWARLLERPLSDGRLTRLGDLSVRPEESYVVVVPPGRAREPAIAAFLAWIVGRLGDAPGADPRPASPGRTP